MFRIIRAAPMLAIVVSQNGVPQVSPYASTQTGETARSVGNVTADSNNSQDSTAIATSSPVINGGILILRRRAYYYSRHERLLTHRTAIIIGIKSTPACVNRVQD